MPKGIGYGSSGSSVKGVSPVKKLKSPSMRLKKRLLKTASK